MRDEGHAMQDEKQSQKKRYTLRCALLSCPCQLRKGTWYRAARGEIQLELQQLLIERVGLDNRMANEKYYY